MTLTKKNTLIHSLFNAITILKHLNGKRNVFHNLFIQNVVLAAIHLLLFCVVHYVYLHHPQRIRHCLQKRLDLKGF